MTPMPMAQKSMMFQIGWRRLPIETGIHAGVVKTGGDGGAIRCCFVWDIGPFIQGVRIVVVCCYYLYAGILFNQPLHRLFISADRTIAQGRTDGNDW